MYVSTMSTQLKGLVIESCVWLTILYHLNCAQNLSARVHMPSNTTGGTPHMPPFEVVGAVPVPPPLLPPLPPPLPPPPL